MIKHLELEDFFPHLNTNFEVRSESSGSIEMALVEVEKRKGKNTQGFSLMFRGPSDVPLVQKTRRLDHPDMGGIELFLAPVYTGKTDGIYYQAVFSRLVG